MTATLRSEWTKLRSEPHNTRSLLAVVVLTVGLTAFLTTVGSTNANEVGGAGDDDVVRNSLFGVVLGQVAVVTFASRTFTGEFGTGLIHTTFVATPRRVEVLVAKLLTTGGMVLAASLVACVTSFLVAQPLLHEGGFVAPAYPKVSLTDGPALRAVVGTALFLTVVALLTVAVSAVLRHGAATLSLLLGMLLAPTIVAAALSENIREWVLKLGPSAGLAIQQTRERPDDIDLAPWAGLGVTCAWAAAAVLLAAWVLRRRDV
jgi:hypothetical protein